MSRQLRAEICEKVKHLICIDRQARHGEPEESFQIIADLWSVYLGRSITLVDVACLMVLFKIGRQTKTSNEDNLLDAAGYAILALEHKMMKEHRRQMEGGCPNA